MSYKWDAFLSHDWMPDERGLSNHERVLYIADFMKKHGDVKLWIDEEEMHKIPDIELAMHNGVEHSSYFVVFITSAYLKKAGGIGPNGMSDNCYFEYSVASTRDIAATFIPVVMEPSLKNTRLWKGKVGARLRNLLYVDLSDSPPRQENMIQLIKRINPHQAAMVGSIVLPPALNMTSQITERRSEGPSLSSAKVAPAPTMQAATRLPQASAESTSKLAHEIGPTSFYFIAANALRNLMDNQAPLPSLHDLLTEHPEWIVVQTFDLAGAVSGKYKDTFASVSHRWENKEQPDPDGQQLQAVRALLMERPNVQYVWYDYWCMYQGAGITDAQKAERAMMMKRINLLYLGCTVFVLSDQQYLGRFWTLMEFWMAMQLCTAAGLSGTEGMKGTRRWIIRVLGAAQAAGDKHEQSLIEMMRNKTPDEAREVLAQQDILVTNQSDKDLHLGLLSKLSGEVREAFAIASERATVEGVSEEDEEANEADQDADQEEARAEAELQERLAKRKAEKVAWPPKDPEFHVFLLYAGEDHSLAKSVDGWLHQMELSTSFSVFDPTQPRSDDLADAARRHVESSSVVVVLLSSALQATVDAPTPSLCRSTLQHSILFHGVSRLVLLTHKDFDLAAAGEWMRRGMLREMRSLSGMAINLGLGDFLPRQLLLMKLGKHPHLKEASVVPSQMRNLAKPDAASELWEKTQALAAEAAKNAANVYAESPMALSKRNTGAQLGSKAVEVTVRVRPYNRRELELGTDGMQAVTVRGNEELTVRTMSSKGPVFHTYSYSKVFWSFADDGGSDGQSTEYATQDTVYRDAGEPILNAALAGYSCCLFAYGQTGSGKSYSVTGDHADPNNEGIVPRVAKQVFEMMASFTSAQRQMCVTCSMLEIYGEELKDLLTSNKGKKLKLQDVPSGTHIAGLTTVECKDYSTMKAKLDEGFKRRTVAATGMNATSSRAHTVFVIKVIQVGFENGEEINIQGDIHLVDLAGSERSAKTGAEGQRFKEAVAINQSLLHLGTVIQLLAKRAKKPNTFVPFSSSKLTMVLKNALSGNSRTLMIAAVSPHADNADETLSTLRYANEALKLKLRQVKVSANNKDIIADLKRQLIALRLEYEDAMRQIAELKARPMSLTRSSSKKGMGSSKSLAGSMKNLMGGLAKPESSERLSFTNGEEQKTHFTKEKVQQTIRATCSGLDLDATQRKALDECLAESSKRLDDCLGDMASKEVMCADDVDDALLVVFERVLLSGDKNFSAKRCFDLASQVTPKMTPLDPDGKTLRSVYGYNIDDVLITMSSELHAHGGDFDVPLIEELYVKANNQLHEVNANNVKKCLFVQKAVDHELSRIMPQLKLFASSVDDSDKIFRAKETAIMMLQEGQQSLRETQFASRFLKGMMVLRLRKAEDRLEAATKRNSANISQLEKEAEEARRRAEELEARLSSYNRPARKKKPWWWIF